MHTITGLFAAAALDLLLAAMPAAAAVDDVAPNGFQVTETLQIAASPDAVYEVLIQPSRWWSSDHTFSHDAANLTLEAKAGGCWCESLPGGGSVQHMIVVYAAPGKTLRLHGALGPLQGMAVDGALTISLKSDGPATDLVMSYAVGGYAKDGFGALAGAVDHVLGEQAAHLKQTVESASR